MTYRTRQNPDGSVSNVNIHDCECVGKAEPKFQGWTPGRRGPPGGVCGACGGAIPFKEDKPAPSDLFNGS